MSKKQKDFDLIMRNLGAKHIKVSGTIIDISDAKEIDIKTFGNLDYLKSQGYSIEGMIKYKSQFKNSSNDTVGFKMPADFMLAIKDPMLKTKRAL